MDAINEERNSDQIEMSTLKPAEVKEKGENLSVNSQIRKMSILPKHLLPVGLPRPTDEEVDEQNALRRSSSRAALFSDVEQLFHDFSDDGHSIDFSHFCQMFGGSQQQVDTDSPGQFYIVRKDFYAKRVFQLMDLDKSHTLDIMEYMAVSTKLVCGDSQDRIKFFFEICDLDDSGTISKDEWKAILWESATEATLRLKDGVLDDLTSAFFGEHPDAQLTYENFYSMLEEYPADLKTLESCIKRCLFPSIKTVRACKENALLHFFSYKALMNNTAKYGFILFLTILNALLFMTGALQYSDQNSWIIAARGFGLCLNFNCAFIMLLVCRKFFSVLHVTHITEFLPIDQHILYHKTVAMFIVFDSIGHAIGHLGNIAIKVNTPGQTVTYLEWLFTDKSGVGWIAGLAYPTGVVLLVILAVMFVCAMPFVRHKGLFQIFYWTHLMYLPFILLIVIHCARFYMFLAAPLVIFAVDKLSRRSIKSTIKSVRLHPSRASQIFVERPDNFQFLPGDYCEINIPTVASFEWHPFSISSAPENTNDLTFHILVRGDWTRKLHAYIASKQRQSRRLTKFYETIVNVDHGIGMADFKVAVETAQKMNANRSVIHEVQLPCYIQGPLGTAARGVFRTEHAVLVGTGIGVTPFASIMRSAIWRFRSVKIKCPNCECQWTDEVPKVFNPLKKIDFIWITRGHQSFDWFLDLLAEVEEEQKEEIFRDFINLRIHVTGSLANKDLKASVLKLGLDAVHRKTGHDLLTGLKTKTRPGRPNWDQLFTEIRNENKGKVKVFVCGSPQLAAAIKKKCTEFKFGFAKEYFDS